MEPKSILRLIYERLACGILGHIPKPFNGPSQDCARCNKRLVMDWNYWLTPAISPEEIDVLYKETMEQNAPSPTPWNFSTWGFYCDTCEKFFDLVTDGKVQTHEGNTCSYEHKECGRPARYIGYDRSKQ